MKNPQTIRILAKNSLLYGISMGIRFVSNAVIYLYMANKLLVDDFGRITLANSYGKLMVVIAAFGFMKLVMRNVASNREKADHYLVNSLFNFTLLSILTMGISYMAVRLLRYSPETVEVVNIFLLMHILNQMGALVSAFFRAIIKFEYELYSSILPDLFLFLSVMYLLKTGAGVIPISLVFLVSRVMYVAITLGFYFKVFGIPRIRENFSLSACRLIIVNSYPFAVWTAMSLLDLQAGTIILSYYASEASVGVFQGALKIVFIGIFALESLSGVCYPYVSNKFSRNYPSFKRNIIAVNNGLMMIMLPLTFYIFAYSREILGFVYRSNSDLIQGWKLLSVLAVAFFFYYAPPFSHVFAAMNKEKINLKVSVCANVINVVICLLFIPRYQEMGVCIACLVSFFYMRAAYVYNLYRCGIPLFDRNVVYYSLIPFSFFVFLIYSIRIDFLTAAGTMILLIFSGLLLYYSAYKKHHTPPKGENRA